MTLINMFFVLLLFVFLMKAMGSYLMMLVLLEFLIFMTFFSYFDMTYSGIVSLCFTMSLFYLIVMIFEGVFGLSLLVSLTREGGGDYYIYW